jgi:hypothetical protein
MTKLISAVLLLSVALTVSAGNLIKNGSFELPAGVNNSFIFNIFPGNNIIQDWTVSRGSVDWQGPFPFSSRAFKGNNSIDLVAQSGTGGIQQAIATGPGHCYDLNFALAGNPGGIGSNIKPLAVNITPAGFALFLGGTANEQSCGPIAGNGVGCTFVFDTTGKSSANMGWSRQGIKFQATSSSTNIEFFSDVTAGGGTLNAGANIDDVHAHKAICTPRNITTRP